MSETTNNWSRKLALVLIICAVVGTEVSYHFTLESRFEAIEEKLAQQTAGLQAMQESLDSTESSKNETLSGLNKQLASLESSFEPLGRTAQAQADALSQLHDQLALLQQAQSSQLDAQKKLSDYLSQLEANVKKARVEAEAVAKPASAPPAGTTLITIPASATNATVSVPASLPAPQASTNPASDLMGSPGAVSHPLDHATSESIAAESQPALAAPRAIAAMDLRPADTGISPRALPVSSSIVR